MWQTLQSKIVFVKQKITVGNGIYQVTQVFIFCCLMFHLDCIMFFRWFYKFYFWFLCIKYSIVFIIDDFSWSNGKKQRTWQVLCCFRVIKFRVCVMLMLMFMSDYPLIYYKCNGTLSQQINRNPVKSNFCLIQTNNVTFNSTNLLIST